MSDLALRAEELVARPRAEIEATIKELVARGPEGVALLREIEAIAPAKDVRKLARRALHQLKSRGVEVEPRRPAARGSVLRPVQSGEEEGVVTPIDAQGRRLVFLVAPVRGGARLSEALLSDVEGVLEVRSRPGRRREARAFVRALLKDRKARCVALPGSQVRTLIARAAESGAPATVDRAVLSELSLGADRTPGEHLREELSGSAQELPPTDAQVDAVVRERVARGTLIAWPLEGDELSSLASGLASVDRSPLVLSDVQKGERRRELLTEAAPRILDAPARERLAARLEETAVLANASGDGEGTRALVALAARVRSAVAPLDVEYLRGCLDLSLRGAAEVLKEEGKGRIIVPG